MSKKKQNEPRVKSTEELKTDKAIAERVMADEQKLIELQTRDVEAARKIFEVKKANTHIVDGRPAYKSLQEYHEAIAEREAVSIERMELQLKDDKSRFDSRLEQNKKTLAHIDELLEARNEVDEDDGE